MPLGMPKLRREKSSTRVRLLAVLAVTAAGCAVLLHAVTADLYYQMMSVRLLAIDEMAVRRGAEYLVQGPQKAIHEVQAFALSHGIAEDEIGFIRMAADGHSIGMALNRKIPRYLLTLSLGLTNRIVSVTAWAQVQGGKAPPSSTPPAVLLFAAL